MPARLITAFLSKRDARPVLDSGSSTRGPLATWKPLGGLCTSRVIRMKPRDPLILLVCLAAILGLVGGFAVLLAHLILHLMTGIQNSLR